jgi:hypothetical protein
VAGTAFRHYGHHRLWGADIYLFGRKPYDGRSSRTVYKILGWPVEPVARWPVQKLK